LADWYVFRHDGAPLGPWSTEVIADEILAGRLPPDVWIGLPGGDRWLRALDVPLIAQRVEGVPTRPRRRDSGLRVVPGTFTSTETSPGQPNMASTVMMVRESEAELVNTPEDAPPTEPSLAPPPAPSSPTPPPTQYKRAKNG
jgi:hypothetical protein